MNPTGADDLILATLVWIEQGRVIKPYAQRFVAAACSLRPKSKYFTHAIKRLTKAGLIVRERGGGVALSEAGRLKAEAGPNALFDLIAVHRAAAAALEPLDVPVFWWFIHQGPNAIPREKWIKAGKASGSPVNAVARIVAAGWLEYLVDDDRSVRAHPELFPEQIGIPPTLSRP